MNFYEVELIDPWFFKIKLPYVCKDRLSYNQASLKYIWSIKRYVNDTIKAYLFEEELEDGVFRFQIGFATFIYNEFINELPQESLSKLESIIFSDLKLPYFDKLYDYQNKDLTQLVSLNRGMFQCYTSYGKTRLISVLADYVSNVRKEKILVVTCNTAALEELTDRFWEIFGYEYKYFDENSLLNVINVNGYLRSAQYDKNSDYWNDLIWIIADEVENCVTETSFEFYENLKSVKYMYGFSATSDKKMADPIYSRLPKDTNPKEIQKAIQKVKDTLGRNKFLVGYYGSTAVFKRPRDFNIKLINVLTSISKDDLELPLEYAYNEVIYSLFTSNRICNLIESIVYKVGLIFIPMFRLEVIDYWIDNYFKKDGFLSVVISSRGYEVYISGEYMGLVNLNEFKKMVSDGIVNAIFGTRKSYSALDLQELNRCLLLYSKTANIVIQAIGRTTRSGKFEIYNIYPIKNIPTYSKDLAERLNLIKSYYSDCEIIESSISENYYD